MHCQYYLIKFILHAIQRNSRILLRTILTTLTSAGKRDFGHKINSIPLTFLGTSDNSARTDCCPNEQRH